MTPKNILVVCWEFPPHHNIGGRRWSKIAKSLIKAGHNLSVISQPFSGAAKDTWISREVMANIKMYSIHSHKLAGWLHNYSAALSPIKIRLAKFLLSNLYKGTIYDKAIGIEKEFLSLASEVIRKNKIETLFVTGAPFNLTYYCARLKELFPQLTIVADYRDPWIHAQNYGMKTLSPRRMRHEVEKQDYVFEHADVITAPNKFLLQEIKDTYTGKATQLARFIELPHAFDPDDVLSKTERPKSLNIKIIYGGTLYIGVDDYLRLLNDAVSAYKKTKSPGLLDIVFYTNELSKKRLFEANADCVTFSEMIGERIFEEIYASDFILIILAEHNKNYTTSKFFEFMPYKKPYLYIGPEGFVSQKIEQEQLGFCIRKASDLAIILDNYKTENMRPEADINKYSFDAVVADFIKKIDHTSEQ